jgi:hypothetical protein
MKKYALALSGLVLSAGAASAQPAEVPAVDHAAPHAEGALPADNAAPATPAQPADPAVPATRAQPADSAVPADAGPPAAEPAIPAEPAAPATPASPPIIAADVSEAEIDSFAKATVRLQAIQADATIAADQKQAAMAAAVTEAGLDPAKYNAIGKAAQADPALRAKVQTAMTRHTTAPPSDG